MYSKELGIAECSAVRVGNNVVEIVAVGTVSAVNIKVDIEQLPFFIHPPMFALYFLTPPIVLPAIHPFCYKERVSFPKDSEVITVLDADGQHVIKVQEIEVPQIEKKLPAPTDTGFCVFLWVGTSKLQISSCDEMVPSVFSREYGPATFGECQTYVDDNAGR